jgi:hypothetical protein
VIFENRITELERGWPHGTGWRSTAAATCTRLCLSTPPNTASTGAPASNVVTSTLVFAIPDPAACYSDQKETAPPLARRTGQ